MMTLGKITTFESEKRYLAQFKQTLLVCFFLMPNQIYAQQESREGSFGVHAGLNKGILDNTLGPSFSFHYAIRTDKVFQLESMFFFDTSSGTTFLSGESLKSKGAGWAAGARINLSPTKNWNPSFLIMPGFIYSSETNSRSGQFRAFSGTICLALSNTFYNKHMLSVGINPAEYNAIVYLKYGFWF